jgi:hypothetical protein
MGRKKEADEDFKRAGAATGPLEWKETDHNGHVIRK